MRLDVFTLFPQWFEWFESQRHVRNAIEHGSELRFFNYRDSTPLSAGQVDDAPYGGGAGMVLRVDVVDAALEAAYGPSGRRPRLVLLAPSGRQLDDELASELAGEPELALLCGRYEGVDERVAEFLVDRELSIGDFILTGGELAAMVVIDAVSRLRTGVLGAEASPVDESFVDGLLEYPHYTRPPQFRDWRVPDILLSGDHGRIDRWRREEALRRTFLRRPDMLLKLDLSEEDRLFLSRLAQELTGPR